MNIQRTLVMIHPDTVQRRLIGELMSRIERKGLKINAMKMQFFYPRQLRKLLSLPEPELSNEEHEERIIVTPIVLLVVSGHEAVKAMHCIIGSNTSTFTTPGSMRGDYSLRTFSLISSSSDEETANTEISHFFTTEEICEYPMVLDGELVYQAPAKE